jgi:anti-anti-sigma factor
MTAQPRITFDQAEAAIVMTLHRKLLDDDLLQDLVPAITEALDRTPQHVALDLSEVQYLPSLAIGTLVRLNYDVEKRHQRLVLIGLQDNVKKVMALTHLDRLFETARTQSEAMALLARPREDGGERAKGTTT